jgi:putative DNA primase/helicase
LTIIGNHLPVLKNVDEAMRRRVNIVPFKHKPDKVDANLSKKLLSRLPPSSRG